MMKTRLSDLSLEELWQLFPIELRPYNPMYPIWYEEKKRELLEVLGPDVAAIHHIGSTAIPSIDSKPIIDILVEVDEKTHPSSLKRTLQKAGWILMHEEVPMRDSYNMGYTIDGFAEKVFHLHLRYKGKQDELVFLDYLLNHEEACLAYEDLKRTLAKRYRHHRDHYTKMKTDFVKKILELAKEGQDKGLR